MFASLVVTLREGVEAALIVAIVLSYLKKSGRIELVGSVYAGLAAGVAISLAGAYAFRRFQIDEDKFEGWGMLIAAVFVASMTVWMWRTAKNLKGQIETKMGDLAAKTTSRFSLGIFVFVFLMIAREGVETVLFLSAVDLNTSAVMNFIGGITGLVLAATFGVLFVKGSIRINLRKFFTVTSIILLVVAVQLLISGLHELSESQVLPSSPTEMALIGPIVKNASLFYVLILGIAAIMILWQRSATPTPAEDMNAAERRKIVHRARREKLWVRSGAVLALLAIVVITADFVYTAKAGELSPPEQVFPGGQDVRIPKSRTDDGNLHRFAYQAADRQVRFILIKMGGDRVGVGLDACTICGDKGYFQQGQQIICRNCSAAINTASIGESGGCNPIELKADESGSDVVIAAADLEKAALFFTAPGATNSK